MPILKVGDVVNFPINLKVIKVFGYRDNLYYIVEVIQQKVPWRHMDRLFGTLNVDGNPDVPEMVRSKADVYINQLRSQDSE